MRIPRILYREVSVIVRHFAWSRQILADSRKTVHISARILRSVSWFFATCLAPLKWVTPNLISLFSICVGVLASLAAATSYFKLFAIGITIWLFLDCLDGDVARLREKVSKGAHFWEMLNSNLQYTLWLPSVALGLTAQGNFSTLHLFFTLLSCVLFTFVRHIVNIDISNRYSLGESSGLTWRLFLFAQTKNASDIRKNFFLANYFFILWRNILTQAGIFPILAILISFVNPLWFEQLLPMYYTLYMAFSLFSISIAFLKTTDKFSGHF